MSPRKTYLIYDSPEDFLDGFRLLSGRGIAVSDAYMPFPVGEADAYLPVNKDRWGLFAFFYGLLGALSGLAMVYYMMAVSYPNNIGGKPDESPVGWVPVIFETALFFAFHLTVVTFLIRKFRKGNTHPAGINPGSFIIVLPDAADKSLAGELEKTGAEIKILTVSGKPDKGGTLAAILLPLCLLCFSCVSSNETPAREYFPEQDMRYFVSYPPNGVNPALKDSLNNRIPATGSIPEGYSPMKLPDTEESYERAKTALQSPLASSEENRKQGRQLYSLYCALCHGEQGHGDGPLSESGKISGVPVFDDQALPKITDGSVYYVLYYGRRMMGKYTPMTTDHERWILAQYVIDLKKENSKQPE